MCGVRTEAQIVKFWNASKTSPHDWMFILKTQTAALLWIIVLRYVENGGKRMKTFLPPRFAVHLLVLM